MPGNDVNEELSRLVARRVAGLSMVRGVRTFPPAKPDRVVARLEREHYPPVVEDVTVDFRFARADEFNVVYVEHWSGETWSCRWDRHENPHSDRDHFHPPPDPNNASRDALAAVYPDGQSAVVGVVFDALRERYTALWENPDEPTYPSEYGFDPGDGDWPFLGD
ncbi:hypothetical protein [Halarchaeum nitratireducens]|uniref:Uncharacterized protein n=1 Tax=Halarchaeum nitratireducens TaxID=489913 RepID=A0A830GCZ5_9EURY|nr:hypothetical protein [Halarchaeum nitratireducens]GGN16312.1 hypothetical protein GCM10009021_16090 [Halarchaeum nitratireducens]